VNGWDLNITNKRLKTKYIYVERAARDTLSAGTSTISFQKQAKQIETDQKESSEKI
jgi:hypothetical protein